MASKLDEARALLVKRLDEIDREREQLVQAIEQLDGLVETQSSAPRSATAGGRRNGRSGSTRRSQKQKRSANGRRKRAPRGEREKQLLSSIKAHPDYRVSDHAREVGVSPQQLYPLLSRLVAKDAIVKKDRKYAVKSA